MASKYKLVCFDLDGTLVDNIKFSWQIFHNYFKTDEVKREKAKESFFAGEITYEQWAAHDIMMWQEAGGTKDQFFDALKDIHLIEGVMETLDDLKKNGLKIALVSGSLSVVLEKCIPNYQDYFDDVFLSVLQFDDVNKLESVNVTKFDMHGKAEALKQVAERENIPLSETVFVGDYLNDLEIMKTAGLGIAFNCFEDELKQAANIVIEKKDLREILPHILAKE